MRTRVRPSPLACGGPQSPSGLHTLTCRAVSRVAGATKVRIPGAQWQGVARQQVQPAKRGALVETAAGGHHRQQILMAIEDVLTADVEPIGVAARSLMPLHSTDAQESM